MDKSEFLKGLHKGRILEETMIEQIRKEKLPLILWGCGDIGCAVFDFLELNDIAVDGIWVDGADGKAYYRGVRIDDLQNIQNHFECFNVIMGHSYYEKGIGLEKRIAVINRVFFPFSISYKQYERVSYEEIAHEVDRFVDLCNHLEDQHSVTNLMAYLNTKMTGDVGYIFDICKENMTFFQNDVFCVGKNEIYLDIGAYNGDTIRMFLDATEGSYKKIIAIEPDSQNFLALNTYIARKRLKNVVTSMIGAWDQVADLQFETGKKEASGVDRSSTRPEDTISVTIYADRLDNLFDEEVSFIKINFFTGVLEAIQGCEGLLKRNRPKIAITVGFNIYNLLLLYEYISSLSLGYKFVLRFNRAMSSALTMYAY